MSSHYFEFVKETAPENLKAQWMGKFLLLSKVQWDNHHWEITHVPSDFPKCYKKQRRWTLGLPSLSLFSQHIQLEVKYVLLHISKGQSMQISWKNKFHLEKWVTETIADFFIIGDFCIKVSGIHVEEQWSVFKLLMKSLTNAILLLFLMHTFFFSFMVIHTKRKVNSYSD